MHYMRKRPTLHLLHHDVRMVRHYAPRDQAIALGVELHERPLDNRRRFWWSQQS